MATEGKVGTLLISIDEGEGPVPVASLVSARLSLQSQMLKTLHPDYYGWSHAVPGTQSWRASSEMLQVVDSVTLAEAYYLQLIEQASLQRTLLDFVFEGPAGDKYQGEGYIDSFEFGGGYDDLYKGSFSVTGVGELMPVFPEAEVGTVFFTVDSSTKAGIPAKSLCRRNPDGSVSVLVTFTGSSPRTLTINHVERRLYTCQGQKIWGCYFDGTGLSLAYEHAGNEVFGIVAMEYGDWAGHLYYTTGASGNDNERVHRITSRGADLTQIGSTFTSVSPGIVVASPSTLLVDARFLNGSILSYGAAGSGYSVVNTQTIYNDQIGIAYDPNTNTVWVQSPSAASSVLLQASPPSTTPYSEPTSINNGSWAHYDVAGARLFYGGAGLRYRNRSSIATQQELTPLSGVDGSFGVNMAVALQN